MFEYFYGQQADLFSFYRIPKVLFTDTYFRNLSTDAKTLYGILLDRMSLSAKNEWRDEHGRVYIIFTVEEIMEAMGCADQKATKMLRELEEKCGLIQRKRQGLGKPNLIYVKNFAAQENSQFLMGEIHDSGSVNFTKPEFPKSRCNNTEINNTEINDINPFLSCGETKCEEKDVCSQYRQYFIEQLDFAHLILKHKEDEDILQEILELLVDVVCSNRKYIRIAGDDKPAEVVKSRLMKLDSEHIDFVLMCMKENTTKVRNMRQYLLATLYNAPLTINSYYSVRIQHDLSNQNK